MKIKGLMDYTPIIRNNLVHLINKYQELSLNEPKLMCVTEGYRHVLKKLSFYPILSSRDIQHIQCAPFIKRQLQYIIRYNNDLDEVIEYRIIKLRLKSTNHLGGY